MHREKVKQDGKVLDAAIPAWFWPLVAAVALGLLGYCSTLLNAAEPEVRAAALGSVVTLICGLTLVIAAFACRIVKRD
jgi:hypothetical protein